MTRFESKNTTAGSNFMGFGNRETKYVRFKNQRGFDMKENKR